MQVSAQHSVYELLCAWPPTARACVPHSLNNECAIHAKINSSHSKVHVEWCVGACDSHIMGGVWGGVIVTSWGGVGSCDSHIMGVWGHVTVTSWGGVGSCDVQSHHGCVGSCDSHIMGGVWGHVTVTSCRVCGVM